MQINRENLAVNPPLSLVEPYVKCYRAMYFSFLDAVGVSMADCDLLMRITAFILLPIILFFVKVQRL